MLIRLAISDEESETKFCAISISFHTYGTFLDATKVEILNLTKTEHANETEVITKPIQKWSKLNIFNIQIFCRNRITGNLQLMHLKNEIK